MGRQTNSNTPTFLRGVTMVTSLFPFRPVTTVGYRSHESGQDEEYIYLKTEDTDYHLVKTVGTRKDYFISSLLISSSANSWVELATGEAASEVTILSRYFVSGSSAFMSMPIPMKFTAGQKISIKSDGAGGDCRVILVGWEE